MPAENPDKIRGWLLFRDAYSMPVTGDMVRALSSQSSGIAIFWRPKGGIPSGQNLLEDSFILQD